MNVDDVTEVVKTVIQNLPKPPATVVNITMHTVNMNAVETATINHAAESLSADALTTNTNNVIGDKGKHRPRSRDSSIRPSTKGKYTLYKKTMYYKGEEYLCITDGSLADKYYRATGFTIDSSVEVSYTNAKTYKVLTDMIAEADLVLPLNSVPVIKPKYTKFIEEVDRIIEDIDNLLNLCVETD
jgi:hypothetical protein